MQRHADPRRPARHQAVHRRAVAGDRCRWATRSTSTWQAGDVRLTMGGEPTFVSIDDMEGAEWKTEALGTHKRRLAGDLLLAAQAPLRPRRPAALRPGQVVSRRAAAALGAALLLADRRRADLAGRIADCRSDSSSGSHTVDDARRFGQAAGRAAGRESRACDRRLRRRPLLHLEGAAPAGQRRHPRLADSKTRKSVPDWPASSSKASPPVGCTLPLRRMWWVARAVLGKRPVGRPQR